MTTPRDWMLQSRRHAIARIDDPPAPRHPCLGRGCPETVAKGYDYCPTCSENLRSWGVRIEGGVEER